MVLRAQPTERFRIRADCRYRHIQNKGSSKYLPASRSRHTKVRLQRFPFNIFYLSRETEIVIVAVAHQSDGQAIGPVEPLLDSARRIRRVGDRDRRFSEARIPPSGRILPQAELASLRY